MNLLAVLGVGLLRILQVNFNKHISPHTKNTLVLLRFTSYFELAAALFCLLYVCITGFYGFNKTTLLCAILSGMCFVAELLTSLAILRTAPLSLANLCSLCGGAVISSIYAIYFFAEPMTWLQWTGVLFFSVAVWFLASSDNNADRKITKTTLLLLALNTLINGFANILSKYFAVRSKEGNSALYALLSYTTAAIVISICTQIWIFQKKDISDTIKQKLPSKLYIIGAIQGCVCATIVFSVAELSRTVPAVIINTVPSVISVIGCLFTGAFLFQEKITVKNIIGVCMGALSVILIICF